MKVVETSIFSRIIDKLLTQESYRKLQLVLISNPGVGKKIKGSGGIRKMRWPGSGHGKRGGIRIIYFWAVSEVTILMLFAYSKTEQADLTRDQIKALRQAIEEGLEMKKENFDELLESVKEGCAILKGEKKPSRVIDFGEPDVKAIRKNLGLTQVQFAAMLGISVATLRNWEQGRRTPEGPAMVLLRVAEKNPEAILDVTQVA